MSLVCPCGCGLQLDQRDLAKQRWLETVAGDATDLQANWELPRLIPHQARRDDEVYEVVECKACGSMFKLAAYLIAFLKLRAAPYPECDACGRMNPS